MNRRAARKIPTRWKDCLVLSANHSELMRDNFDKLEEEAQQLVMEVGALFHFRTGKRQYDGSMGEIRITPKELRDALSYMILHDGGLTER